MAFAFLMIGDGRKGQEVIGDKRRFSDDKWANLVANCSAPGKCAENTIFGATFWIFAFEMCAIGIGDNWLSFIAWHMP
jgi:hypothetical protein